MRRTLTWITACSLAGLIMVAGLGEVFGGAAFKGQIRVLTKMPKAYYPKASQFKSFIASHTTKYVYESGDDRTWQFNIMAFFKRKLGDNEVTLMFYDRGKFVDSQIKMTRNYNSDTLLCSVRLNRPPFDAEKTYEVVAQDKNGNKLAKGMFTTRGTTQAAIDQQKRIEYTQKEMEKSMKELEKKAKEQEEAQKRKEAEKNKKAADSLF
jgi:hypothetical protein